MGMPGFKGHKVGMSTASCPITTAILNATDSVIDFIDKLSFYAHLFIYFIFF
uniref:Uncharacterized protein n=1 Tax=Anguilla anguilla TaxID=7936 RepID=A0A0E9R435_ANGAN